MAITRTLLHDPTESVMMKNVFDYLNENAVPDYFTEVQQDEESGDISCYIGEKEFLKIHISHSYGTYVEITVKCQNTIDTKINNTGNSTAEISQSQITYAYKTANSISLCTNNGGNTSLSNTVKLTITKDNAGETALIWLSGHSINSTGGNTFYTAKADSMAVSANFTRDSSYFDHTVLSAFPVGDSINYTPNVFCMPFTQFTTPGIIEIDGSHYVSNGLWCAKDE